MSSSFDDPSSSILDSAVPSSGPGYADGTDGTDGTRGQAWSTPTDANLSDTSSKLTTVPGTLATNHTASAGAHPIRFQQHLIESGNIIGGVPTSHDAEPSAAMLTAYLVFLAILGIRSLYRRSAGSVDFWVLSFLMVRVTTFAIRTDLSDEDPTHPETGKLIAEGILMLLGPLLLMSPLLTVIVNIAMPIIDALKARDYVDRLSEGESRRPGGGLEVVLIHLPQVFQAILGLGAALTAVVALRFHEALQGHHEARKEVHYIKSATSVVLSAVTIFTLLIIIVLWAKLVSAGKNEFYLATYTGRSRKAKAYRLQAFMATTIAIVTAVFMMYRAIQSEVAIDNRVNNFNLFWCLYVAPEAFVALLFVLYSFPTLSRQEETVTIPTTEAEERGCNSSSNDGPAPSMRTVARNAS
ncbi:unnamed protein product, partial [Tilletia controversa]